MFLPRCSYFSLALRFGTRRLGERWEGAPDWRYVGRGQTLRNGFEKAFLRKAAGSLALRIVAAGIPE